MRTDQRDQAPRDFGRRNVCKVAFDLGNERETITGIPRSRDRGPTNRRHQPFAERGGAA
jgi:hypothetical protein